MIALSLSAPPKSFVADFVALAAGGCGLTDTNINTELFNQAIELVRASKADDFDVITDLLGQNSCDASCVFGVPVTPETDIAFASYLFYAV